MEHKLIKTENYLLVVDDSEIKEKEWCYIPFEGGSIKRKGKYFADDWKKIIAHLPLNNSPILEGVDLLPPIEYEVEKLAKEWNDKGDFTSPYSFRAGYNKAKEKYKYTEEDMINAILFGMQKGLNVGKVDETDCDWVNNYVKSLQQPKISVGFECEMITMNKGYTEKSDYPYQRCDIPKTNTNSQGLTQWVGKYIY